jgi:hypothetical protein
LREVSENLGTTVFWLRHGKGPKSKADWDEFVNRYSQGELKERRGKVHENTQDDSVVNRET